MSGARQQGDQESYGNEENYHESYARNYHHKEDQMNI